MHGIAELLSRRIVGIVAAQRRVVGLVAIGAPVALVLASVGVEPDRLVIAVAVRDDQFIGFLVDEQLSGTLDILGVVAALALAGLADLHQEFAVLSKLQNHVVVVVTACRWLPGWRARSWTAVPADPNVPFVVDCDSVVGLRPIVAWPGSAPMPDQVTRFIEFQYWRRGGAAVGRGWRGLRVRLHSLEGSPAMNDPDMILRVHGYADHIAHDPMVRQGLGPHGVHFEPGGLRAGSLHNRLVAKQCGRGSEAGNQHKKRSAHADVALLG